MKFILLINVKMLTNVGILTFISMIMLKERKTSLFVANLSFYQQLKFRAQLS